MLQNSYRLKADNQDKSELLSQSRTSSCMQGSEDYQAPAINIIEDKSQFSVSKHIKGIKQDGFDFGFTPVLNKNNNINDNKIASKSENNQNKAAHSIKNSAKKAKVSEEDYIQLLLSKSAIDKTKSKTQHDNTDPILNKLKEIKPLEKRNIKLQKYQSDNKSQPKTVVK